MSYSIRISAQTREAARAAIEKKMGEVAQHFPKCAQAKDAILALFDSQPDFNAVGYIVEARGGVHSEETVVRIHQLRVTD